VKYSDFIENAREEENNKFFSSYPRRNFYLFGDKSKINQIIDFRVEEMLAKDNFFSDTLDFAKKITELKDPHLIKVIPLFKSIGFLQTIQFL
jgi:hypothetical protein